MDSKLTHNPMPKAKSRNTRLGQCRATKARTLATTNSLQAQLPHGEHRFQYDLAIHLGRADLAIHEHDRHLAYVQAAPQGAVIQLDLKGIAVRIDLLDQQCC